MMCRPSGSHIYDRAAGPEYQLLFAGAMNTNRKGIVAYLLIAFGLAWAGFEAMYRFNGILLETAGVAISRFRAGGRMLRGAQVGDARGIRRCGTSASSPQMALLLGGVALANRGSGLHRDSVAYFRCGYRRLFHEPGIPDLCLRREATPGMVPARSVPLLCIWLVQAIVGAPVSFGEEFGWRGYLQKRLFPENPVLSAVVTGIIWGYWHFPAAIRGYSYPSNPIVGALVMYPLFGIILSFIFGWLVQKTGSVWSSSVAHAATNVIGGGLSIFLFGGARFLYVGYGGLLGLIPLGALSAWIVFTGQLKPTEEAPHDVGAGGSSQLNPHSCSTTIPSPAPAAPPRRGSRHPSC